MSERQGGQSAEKGAVVHLDAETLLPVGVSTPCRATVFASLGFQRVTGVNLPCGLLAGHDGPHVYHVEWTTPTPPEGTDHE